MSKKWRPHKNMAPSPTQSYTYDEVRVKSDPLRRGAMLSRFEMTPARKALINSLAAEATPFRVRPSVLLPLCKDHVSQWDEVNFLATEFLRVEPQPCSITDCEGKATTVVRKFR